MLTGKLLYFEFFERTMISEVGLVQHHPQLANGADCLPAPVIISEDKGPSSYTIQFPNLGHT